MASINKVILVGRLGQDPQRKHRSDGKEFSSFSVATSRKVQGNEITAWHNVTCWSETNAAYVNSYAVKGSLVYLEGQIEPRSYEKDGVTHYTYDIVIPGYGGTVQILKDGRPREQGNEQRGNSTDYERASAGASRRRPEAKPEPVKYADELDDEIPF